MASSTPERSSDPPVRAQRRKCGRVTHFRAENLPLARTFPPAPLELGARAQILSQLNEDCPRPDAPGMATGDSTTSAKPFRGRSRRRRWEQLSRGLYIPRASPSREVLHGWQLVLPDTAASTSLTAAEVRGWCLPEAIPHPVFTAVPVGERYPERRGLLICRHPQPVPAEAFNGLRITTGAETLLAAARDLGLLDLVILGDSALHLGHCTLEELQLTAAQRRRGVPQTAGDWRVGKLRLTTRSSDRPVGQGQ
jgi:hypothetical protein